MKIQSYNFFNPDAKIKININDFLKTRFEQTDSVFKYFNKINSSKLDEYILAFQTRLNSKINGSKFNISIFNIEDMNKNLTILQNYPEIEEAIINFTCKLLNLSEDLNALDNEIEVLYFNMRKAELHLSYYRVKAIEDILDKVDAIKLYKEIVGYLIKEMKERNPIIKPEDPRKVTRIESREYVLKNYKKYGVGDFTLVIFDDYKELYKFDRCVVSEVLKEFNDPDIAYLSSCYNRDHPSNNEEYTIHLRRTQTLHHKDFCDELYWNNFVHSNTKQPPLVFAKKLGNEDPAKLIEKYSNKI